MSEELPAGSVVTVNLQNEGNAARDQLAQFSKDVRAAIKDSKATPQLQKAAMNALRECLREVGSKKLMEPFSSEANGAAVKHQDSLRTNQAQQANTAGAIGTVALVAAAATGNPIAKAISDEIAPAASLEKIRDGNFATLEKALGDCGIKNIGKPPKTIQNACNDAKKNVGTIAAIKSLRQNGFNGDYIYAKPEEINTKTNFADGVKDYVVSCAERLQTYKSAKNPGSLRADILDFMEKPKAVTNEMRQVAEMTGQKVETTVRGADAQKIKTDVAAVKNEAITTPAVPAAAAPPVRRLSGTSLSNTFKAAMTELNAPELAGGISQALLDNPQTEESLDSENANTGQTPSPTRRRGFGAKGLGLPAAPVPAYAQPNPNGFTHG